MPLIFTAEQMQRPMPLGEPPKKNAWDRTTEAEANMSPLDEADLITSATGIFDPTPISDGAGLLIATGRRDPMTETWVSATQAVPR